MAKGEPLPAGGSKVEVHGREHRAKKRQRRGTREQADRKQRTAPILDVVVNGGPQSRIARQ
eukprot:1134372-Prymnesium_polylepis.1